MNDSAMIDKVYNFFLDKSEMEGYLRRVNKGEQPETESIEMFLEDGEKYRSNPTLYHALEPSLSEFRALQSRLNPNPRLEQNKTISANRITSRPKINYRPQETDAITLEAESVKDATTTPTATSINITMPIATPITTPTTTPATTPTTTLSSESICSFFGSQGIVGEERNSELMMYGLAAKANMGIESISGSGKSALLYALLKALPPEKYLTIHQATDRSLYHNPKINTCNYIVIPELQKIFSRDIEEIIKNLTEGIDSTYTRTNQKRNGVDTFKIGKKPILYSFAITNKHLKERDDEFYRRFIIFHTDISKEQNKKVALSFAERELQPDKKEEDYSVWQKHISSCLDSTVEVKNPFLPHIIKSLPPEISEQVRFRSSVKYLHQLICGATLFNSKPIKTNQKYIFSGISENLRVINLYEQVLIDNLYGLSVIDRALLDLLDSEPTSCSSTAQRFKEIYAAAFPIEDSLSKLTAIGLVGKEGNDYQLRVAPKITINPEQALDETDKFMQLHFPQCRDQWHEQCLEQIQMIK